MANLPAVVQGAWQLHDSLAALKVQSARVSTGTAYTCRVNLAFHTSSLAGEDPGRRARFTGGAQLHDGGRGAEEPPASAFQAVRGAGDPLPGTGAGPHRRWSTQLRYCVDRCQCLVVDRLFSDCSGFMMPGLTMQNVLSRDCSTAADRSHRHQAACGGPCSAASGELRGNRRELVRNFAGFRGHSKTEWLTAGDACAQSSQLAAASRPFQCGSECSFAAGAPQCRRRASQVCRRRCECGAAGG